MSIHLEYYFQGYLKLISLICVKSLVKPTKSTLSWINSQIMTMFVCCQRIIKTTCVGLTRFNRTSQYFHKLYNISCTVYPNSSVKAICSRQYFRLSLFFSTYCNFTHTENTTCVKKTNNQSLNVHFMSISRSASV